MSTIRRCCFAAVLQAAVAAGELDRSGAQGLRLNHAQQITRYPTDTGLSRIEELTGKPRPWLSKKFQRI